MKIIETHWLYTWKIIVMLSRSEHDTDTYKLRQNRLPDVYKGENILAINCQNFFFGIKISFLKMHDKNYTFNENGPVRLLFCFT